MDTPVDVAMSITRLSAEINRPAKNAVQNPDTLKPGTSAATSNSISALMTSRKNPNVSSVSGSVNTMKTGRMTALANPSSSADIHKAPLLLNSIPWKTLLANQSNTLRRHQCRKKVSRLCSNFVSRNGIATVALRGGSGG